MLDTTDDTKKKKFYPFPQGVHSIVGKTEVKKKKDHYNVGMRVMLEKCRNARAMMRREDPTKPSLGWGSSSGFHGEAVLCSD